MRLIDLSGRKINNHKHKSGFALPTILIASIIMMSVLLVSVVSTAAVSASLQSQYYNQIAHNAGDAGVAYANACLAANGGVPMWSDANPLTPGTDCAGNQLPGFTCATASSDTRCSLTVNGGTGQVLVIGGGGGGSNSGGGAGGYLSGTQRLGGAMPVVVGTGGAGGVGAYPTLKPAGSNGLNSSFGTFIAYGGGGGGGDSTGYLGSAGGSSGGSGPWNASNVASMPIGQGNAGGGNGGFTDAPMPSGGGGGAGTNGSNSPDTNTGGNGGAGINNAITGTIVGYAGGGGGGGWVQVTNGIGTYGGGTANATSSSNTVVGNNGTDGTGGGGGGVNTYNLAGGSGGSGIVVISYPSGSITATGGTITYSGGNTIHTFTSSGSFNVTSVSGVTLSTFSVGLPSLVNGKASKIKSVGSTELLRTSTGSIWRQYNQTSVDTLTQYVSSTMQVLVVAGGGGGGSFAGGAGAGGLVNVPAFSITSKTYTVKVGAGGAGATTSDSGIAGSKGGDSAFSQITAAGGGGGGTRASAGGVGGSGGGASPVDSGVLELGGIASPAGQGNNGGTQISFGWGGSGGGGAGAVGAGGNGNNGGNGGVGVVNPIVGSTTGQNVAGVYYLAGGGGGGTYSGGAGTVGTGGNGGGGAGTRSNNNGVDGTPNTGGGGGGSDYGYIGGAGGSGVVIISYPTNSITASGGVVTSSGGNTIHTFTTSGNFVVGAGQRTSCQAILNAGESTGDGMYWIYPSGSTGLNVYCDMTTDGGGWTKLNSNFVSISVNKGTATWNGDNINGTCSGTNCGVNTRQYTLTASNISYSNSYTLLQRSTTVQQCSAVGNATSVGWYNPPYTGAYNNAGTCTWSDGVWANTTETDMTNLKLNWVFKSSGTNFALTYDTQCSDAGDNGAFVMQWFVR